MKLNRNCSQCSVAIPPPKLRKGTKFCSRKCFGMYLKTHPKKQVKAKCHPSRVHMGLGLCGPCYRRKYRQKNITRLVIMERDWARKHADLTRAYRLKSTFGLTVEQWDTIFKNQGGHCPICQHILHKYRNPEGKRAAAIDHDHKTGKVRGLVCQNCNRHKIGTNTLETAKRLVVYLESNGG